MDNQISNMYLEKYSKEYENDPEFIAEGLSIKIVEEMLECMDDNDLNQSWLAQKLGVSRAHISKILNAPPNMTLLTIAKIAVALGVKPDIRLNAEMDKPVVICYTTADNINIDISEFKKQYKDSLLNQPYRLSSVDTFAKPESVKHFLQDSAV